MALLMLAFGSAATRFAWIEIPILVVVHLTGILKPSGSLTPTVSFQAKPASPFLNKRDAL